MHLFPFLLIVGNDGWSLTWPTTWSWWPTDEGERVADASTTTTRYLLTAIHASSAAYVDRRELLGEIDFIPKNERSFEVLKSSRHLPKSINKITQSCHLLHNPKHFEFIQYSTRQQHPSATFDFAYGYYFHIYKQKGRWTRMGIFTKQVTWWILNLFFNIVYQVIMFIPNVIEWSTWVFKSPMKHILASSKKAFTVSIGRVIAFLNFMWALPSSCIYFISSLRFFFSGEKIAIIAFPGTQYPSDMGTNVSGWVQSKVKVEFAPGLVHQAINDLWEDMKQFVLAEVDELEKRGYTRVIVTGHSLGGAVGTLATSSIKKKLDGSSTKRKLEVHLITFGATKIGDNTFRDGFESSVGCENVIHKKFRKDYLTKQNPFFYPLPCSRRKDVLSYEGNKGRLWNLLAHGLRLYYDTLQDPKNRVPHDQCYP